ncbi:unnamed protein product [Mytilus coruscus]|uniref:Uncharacterized protein n=1 Tax=Mytilus coruscus TaxID=42192 RepID=A0A6J8CGE8_MYTCO|nr:unnamed protein product [Mytilus coruscus]
MECRNYKSIFLSREKVEDCSSVSRNQKSRLCQSKTSYAKSNGNIHVADCHPDSDRGRVVVLGQGGDIINTYTRNTEINKDYLFQPVMIVTTPRDNVIVVDLDTDVFHILNNIGEYSTHYSTNDIAIICALSLAFTPTGQLYIGCTRSLGSTTKEAMIYQVMLSGC